MADRYNPLPEGEKRLRKRKYNIRYLKTKSGMEFEKKYRMSEKRRGVEARYRKKIRSVVGYMEWEAIMRDARREARATGHTTREIADEWGITPWRVWRWRFVDYSKHDVEEDA